METLGNGGTARAERPSGSPSDWRHWRKEPCRKKEDLGKKASVLLKTTVISVICFETASAVK